MAISTDELLLKIRVDAETGKLILTEQELAKLKGAAAGADASVAALEKKITSASIAFERKARAVQNSRDSIIRAQAAFSGFGGTIGQVGNQVFNLSNQVEDLEFASKRAGKEVNVFTDSLEKSTGALGKLGTASLVVSAAMAGWKLGSMINQIDGVAAAVEGLWAKLIKLDPVLNRIAQSNKAVVTAESIAGLKAQTDALNVQLWEKYGKTVSSAGKTVNQYNKEVLAALHQQKDFVNTTDQVVTVTAKADKVTSSYRSTVAKTVDTQKEFTDAIKEGGKSFEEMGGVLSSLTDSVTEWNNAAEKMGLIAEDSIKNLTNNFELLAPAIDEAAEASEKLDKFLEENADSLDLVNDKVAESISFMQKWGFAIELVGRSLADAFGGRAGAGINAAIDGIMNFTNIMEQFANMGAGPTASKIGALGVAIEGVGSAIGGTSGQVVSAMGRIASWAVIGMQIGGWWGAAIGAIAGAFVSLWHALKKDWGSIVAKEFSKLLPGIGISDDLAESITDLAKATHDARFAITANIGAIVQQVTITRDNIGTLIPVVRDLFTELQKGRLTASAVIDQLEASFGKLAEAADKFGGAYANQIVEIIQLTRQFGLEVAAVTDYVNSKINIVADSTRTLAESLKAAMDAFKGEIPKIPGMDQFTGQPPFPPGTEQLWRLMGKGFKIPIGQLQIGEDPSKEVEKQIAKIKGQFDTLVSFVSAGFAQIIANGGSITDFFNQFGDQLGVLQEAAERFGFDMGGTLGDLAEFGDIIHGKLAGMLADISAVGAAMGALGSIGVAPTMEEFDKFGDSVDKAFKKMVKGGASEALALAQIAPQLKVLAQLQDQYGLKVDKATQKLIDQARAAGLLDPTPQEQMLEATNRMADSLDQLVMIFSGATDAAGQFADQLNQIPDTIDVNVNTNYTSSGSGNFGTNPGGGGVLPRFNTSSGTTRTSTGIRQPVTVQLVVDRRVLGEVTMESIEDGTIRLDRLRKTG